eukprot:768607-Hanusia_phi.AAC.10
MGGRKLLSTSLLSSSLNFSRSPRRTEIDLDESTKTCSGSEREQEQKAARGRNEGGAGSRESGGGAGSQEEEEDGVGRREEEGGGGSREREEGFTLSDVIHFKLSICIQETNISATWSYARRRLISLSYPPPHLLPEEGARSFFLRRAQPVG